MREIKFRAWDGKSMVFHSDLKQIAMSEAVGYYNWGNLEIMQYTGLRDKNGKEIYEGDIVKGLGYDEDLSEVILEPSGGFYYAWSEYGHSAEDIEVIGNIYENPELLN